MNALTLPTFIIYFVTNTLSLLGTWIQKVGLGWLAWQITESTFWTSVASLLLMAPVGFLSPFIAVFAEGWNARHAMILTKVSMASVSFLILIIQAFNQHNLVTLLICSALLGLLSAFHHPVRLVFISLVVPKPYLASAVGMNSVSWNMSRIIGPGLAGSTIYFMGLSETFFTAAVLYLPLCISLCFLDLQPRLYRETKNSTFFKKMCDGAVITIRTPIIFSTLLLVFVNSFFVRGVLEIQPAIAGQMLGGESFTLAIITAAAGLGSLIASVWIGLGKLDKAEIQKFLQPMIIIGIFVTASLNLFNSLTLVGLVFVTAGFTTTIVGIGAQTLIQLEVEENYRARIMTWWSTISFGSLVIGGIITGFLGDLMGLNNAILLMMLIGGPVIIFVSAYISKSS